MTAALKQKTFSDAEPVRVSICCITYNHRDYIIDCIEGFLEQETDFRVEIVIHDDASTDGTAEIIRDYATKYPTIVRSILQTENQYSKGVNPYYAYVFQKARGEYLALCDGDDYWSDPLKLSRQVAVLDVEPHTVITYGSVRAFDANGTIPDYQGGIRQSVTSEQLKAGVPLNTLTTCFRNIFKGCPPPIFLRNSPIGDLTVWGILGYHGEGRYLVDLAPANYRIHENGVLSLQNANKKNLMTALAQLNLAAFHAELADVAACKRSLLKLSMFLNATNMVTFKDISPGSISFRGALRLWLQSRKRSRAKKN